MLDSWCQVSCILAGSNVLYLILSHITCTVFFSPMATSKFTFTCTPEPPYSHILRGSCTNPLYVTPQVPRLTEGTPGLIRSLCNLTIG
ncbi:hypothetical protein L873DRAFT_160102 [Choiromyces venosus 120613-1]|uniref:Uncharacterized protein n=1 Tax=Choiromyces venosus 120613-1 TaxID=1336337 RepID=A0A3N4JYF8_9PEZI|nr:hypothetical protein L873DRAFT_160102 [Choiromyces venosus 120613-1]